MGLDLLFVITSETVVHVLEHIGIDEEQPMNQETVKSLLWNLERFVDESHPLFSYDYDFCDEYEVDEIRSLVMFLKKYLSFLDDERDSL